jgi:hypothetical protein
MRGMVYIVYYAIYEKFPENDKESPRLQKAQRNKTLK